MRYRRSQIARRRGKFWRSERHISRTHEPDIRRFMMLAADHRAGRNPSVQFTLSVPPSRTSSPSPSPSDDLEFSSLDGYLSLNEKAPNAQNNHKSLAVNAGPFVAGEDLIPGRLSTNIYDTTLPRWRAAIRRSLVKTVRRESEVIARMQVSTSLSCPGEGARANYLIRECSTDATPNGIRSPP